MTYYIAEIRFNRSRNLGRERRMRKRLTLRLITLLLISLLFSASIMIISVAACRKRPVCKNGEEIEPIIEALEELSSEIDELPIDAFRNPRCEIKDVLLRKIHVVIWQVTVGAYGGALNKLWNDIKKKIERWIIDDDARMCLVGKVCNIIKLILALCWPIHDIAITGVTASPTEVYVGESVYINVTVANQGTKPETFDVSVYYDSVLIETRTGVSLAICTSTTLTFIWDTTDIAEGTYTIKAEVPPVPKEKDTTDNTYIDRIVTVLAKIGWIEGTVTDAKTSAAIKGATVEADGYSAVTGACGYYIIQVPAPATYTVTAEMDQYYTETTCGVYVDVGETVTVNFALVPIPHEGWINGTVIDAGTALPIEGANVTAGGYSTLTAEDGTYEIEVYAPATYNVKASAEGYYIRIVNKVFVDKQATVTVDFALYPIQPPVVIPSRPVASFTWSPPKPVANETVTFNATASYDPDGYIVSYLWIFGDGAAGFGKIVKHIYTSGGTYTVTLFVTDNYGLISSASANITVSAPPVASFTYSLSPRLTPYTGETITFNATASYDPDGYIVSYFWDFGDGTNATDVITTHAYADDGVYTVTLNVTDNDGLSDIASADVTVLNRPPVAVFTESATTVLTGAVINFDASGSYDCDGSIVSYVWDFGDGTDATGITVAHAYADDGTYTVTLTVTDDDGASASVSVTKTVLNRPPVALFTESAETVAAGVTITFNASQSYDPDGFIVSYFWDFGDGTTATGVVVEHPYNEDGTYTVTLMVMDNDGAFSSVSATKTVETPVGLPLAWFAAIGFGIAALTATLLYALYRRGKRGKSAANLGNKPKPPVVTLYVPAKLLSRFELKPLKRRSS